MRWHDAKAHDYFAAVRPGKSYVSPYLLVADTYPDALDATPEALLKRLSGKTAFTGGIALTTSEGDANLSKRVGPSEEAAEIADGALLLNRSEFGKDSSAVRSCATRIARNPRTKMSS